MLPKENRLRKPADFQTVKQNGKRWRKGPMMVSVVQNNSEQSRFGFIIPKKVGNAVARNTVKRRLRRIIYQQLHQLHSGFDVVVIGYPKIASLSFSELEFLLLSVLSQASVLEQ